MNRLKTLRLQRRLSQKEVANVLNISQQQYSRIEKEDVKINADKLIKLAKLFNTSIDYILGLTDNPKPYDS
ncbi:MAG: helix-turn-helix domain-containing protein [Acutalibacteraceae bacterium]|jgi:transcriptional regulator